MKTKVIKLTGSNKWLNLLHHFNGSVSHIFRIECEDEAIAKLATHRMQDLINNHGNWFNMVVVRKGLSVLVIKTLFAQKVVLVDE